MDSLGRAPSALHTLTLNIRQRFPRNVSRSGPGGPAVGVVFLSRNETEGAPSARCSAPHSSAQNANEWATRQLHFLTFSCYRRRANFAAPQSRACFESSLERVRQSYGLCVYGYVVMPEHVHLLVNEPERGGLAQMLQSLKQSVARTLALRSADSFWQARYYDFNVWSERKFVEKLRYIHRNPVTRGLVERPDDWLWSSFRQLPHRR